MSQAISFKDAIRSLKYSNVMAMGVGGGCVGYSPLYKRWCYRQLSPDNKPISFAWISKEMAMSKIRACFPKKSA